LIGFVPERTARAEEPFRFRGKSPRRTSSPELATISASECIIKFFCRLNCELRLNASVGTAGKLTEIYHITHVDNLRAILRAGGLHSDRQAQDLQCTRIGHQHIKARRLNRRVPLAPGGTVGDYVPFYFAPRSPMLYAINGGYVEGYQGGQEPVLHLRSSAEAVNDAGLRWVFTEGHAEIAYSDFFGDLADLDKVDWDVMKSRYWNDTNEDPDRKRRRQAEFLVHQFFPWRLVSYIGVYDQSTRKKMIEILGNEGPDVGIEKGWYYW